MKLFQQMLVAGASLSLLAPVAAQASDVVNLEEMNSYARSTKKNSSRIDSNTFTNKASEDIAILETKESNFEAFEAGAFSSTTSMDGKAVFWIGLVGETVFLRSTMMKINLLPMNLLMHYRQVIHTQ